MILEFLTLKGIFCWRNHSTGTFDPTTQRFRKLSSIKGVSDILGIYRSRFLAIEVKSAKGRATKDQLLFLERVNASGGIGFIARSIDDVINKLSL